MIDPASPPRQRRRICHTCSSVFQPPHRYYGPFCENCRDDFRATEAHRVLVAVLRAQEHGTAASLTLEQWLQTVSFFNKKCAYCQSRSYEILEHVLELSRGGSSSQANCVPSCRKCNSIKRDFSRGSYVINPDWFAIQLKRVQDYLVPYYSKLDEVASDPKWRRRVGQ